MSSSPSPALEPPTILFVKRLAYRESPVQPWEWFGPTISFPFVFHTDYWNPEYQALESLSESLRDRYDTLEDYLENVKIIQAPTAESLDLVDLNAPSLSPLVFPLPHS